MLVADLVALYVGVVLPVSETVADSVGVLLPVALGSTLIHVGGLVPKKAEMVVL